MEKLNHRELYKLCDVTQERIIRVNKVISSISIMDDEKDEPGTITRELIEMYQAEKLELEALLEKLLILKLEA